MQKSETRDTLGACRADDHPRLALASFGERCVDAGADLSTTSFYEDTVTFTTSSKRLP